MKAAALAVGSELLGSDRLDSNSLALADLLSIHGVELVAKSVVGDQEDRIASELRRLAKECDLLVVSGGLGPTEDDRTRAAAAQAFGLDLRMDPAVLAALEQRFLALDRPMAEVNRRQAEVLEGCEVLENLRGTAPGLRIEATGSSIWLLPGVPGEYRHLLERHMVPWLAKHAPGGSEERAVVRVACLPESEVEQRIRPVYELIEPEAVSVLASPGDIRIRVTAPRAQAEQVRRVADRIEELVGRAVFARSEQATLEGVVGEALRSARASVATAESCTGGLLAQRLTATPGSSEYFPGGVVAYSNAEKVRLLGVREALLVLHGAVSEEVSCALAAGVRRSFATDFGVGITGIAGPDGGTEDKPVGTVHVAIAGPGEEDLLHRQLRLPGDRGRVRQLSSQVALEMLRRRLLEAESV